ncbi:MAG: RT0821/Lpp0805 family surface protein [Rhodovibrionaceae bacterium]|nr:RT0821/Lpp0805 family surface protein [Rhodovibrionaceae bacterium]
MKLKSVIAVVVAAMLVSACQNGPGPKEAVGGVVGGAAGAVAGAQFGSGRGQLAMTALGAVLGAYIGSEVGRDLDELDRVKAEQAFQKAARAPVGETIYWDNPENDHRGTVTPVREGTSESGRYCREFQTTVTVGGKTEQAYGTACRQPDGSWQVVS